MIVTRCPLILLTDGFELLLTDEEQPLETITPEQVLNSLGLNERQPIPDVITFPEPDPLGAMSVLQTKENDIISSISK